MTWDQRSQEETQSYEDRGQFQTFSEMVKQGSVAKGPHWSSGDTRSCKRTSVLAKSIDIKWWQYKFSITTKPSYLASGWRFSVWPWSSFLIILILKLIRWCWLHKIFRIIHVVFASVRVWLRLGWVRGFWELATWIVSNFAQNSFRMLLKVLTRLC